jgi:hypothetical protein
VQERPLFPRWSNSVFAIGGLALVSIPVVVLTGLMTYVRTPFHTWEKTPVNQPIQFDHRHHVADDGIDCRYCHHTVDKSPSAGIPSTSVCMGCHSQVWSQSPMLALVRESYFRNRPIAYKRVYDLPDFVFFNHRIHVDKGVGCATCHGRVDQMARIQRNQGLMMSWCLDCHRHPERFLRPREEITNMSYQPPPNQEDLGRQLIAEYSVHTRTDCATCHR